MKHVAILGLLLIILSGCVDYSEELWLKKDGSGRVKMTVGVMTNYENIHEIDRYMDQPGITLISRSVSRKDKYTYYRLDFKFDSIEAFNALNDQISNADFFGRITLREEKDGTIVMKRKIALGSMASEEDEIEKLIFSQAQEKLSWHYKLHLPWEIIKSNAAPANVDFTTNTVSWEYQTAHLWNKSQLMTVTMKRDNLVFPTVLKALAGILVIIFLIWLLKRRKKALPVPEAENQAAKE